MALEISYLIHTEKARVVPFRLTGLPLLWFSIKLNSFIVFQKYILWVPHRVLNSAHELLFCAVNLNGMLASQTFVLMERSLSRALRRCIPAIALTKGKTPLTTCTGTGRIVLVLTGLGQVRSGNFRV